MWDEFLPACEIANVGAEIRQHRPIPATVYRSRGAVVDRNVRDCSVSQVPEPLNRLLLRRLADAAPVFGRYFSESLSGFETPQLIRYRRGSHFGLHRDDCPEAQAPELIRSRRVSVVVFLNNGRSAESSGDFDGGALVIYEPRLVSAGREHRIVPEVRAGRLVAFPSNLWHQVLPVTRGIRLSIASWWHSVQPPLEMAHDPPKG
jgi:predicted 2-oxoglutarate/Fe(II)-dependent dioxygenase YbiX